MKKITTTIAALLAGVALVATAAPASAATFPPNWQCKLAEAKPGAEVYNCRATVRVKTSTHKQYLWATKLAKANISQRAALFGAPYIDIPVMGCRPQAGSRWLCSAQWTMQIPA